jgi:peptide deformylase
MKLIKAPNNWLNKEVKLFDFKQLNALETSSEMISTMKQHGGIGLSANQVGIDAQIFVMKSYLTETKEPLVIINPSILQVSKEVDKSVEGCLSYLGLFLSVSRPVSIVAKYFDIDNKECTIALNDLNARCFLHEFDHLMGINFIDRVSKLQLSRSRKKQKKIKDKKW